jgi:hypothetical protein
LSGVVGSSHEPPNAMDETVTVARQGSIDDATQVVPPVPAPPALDPTPTVGAYAGNGQAPPQTTYMSAAETRPVPRQTQASQNGNGHGRRRPPVDEPKPRGSWGGRILILLAVLALLSVIAMAQFLVKGAINKDQGSGTGTSTNTPQTSAPPAATGQKVTIVAAKDFDPPPGNGEEHPNDVKNTYDGKQGTTWTTMSYKNRPDLGGTKKGVGIYYDLGELTDVSQVTVSLVGSGTNLELMIPKSDQTKPATSVSGWQSVAKVDNATDTAALKPASPTKTQYVLVWLTSLPKEGSGYRGEISEVSIQK